MITENIHGSLAGIVMSGESEDDDDDGEVILLIERRKRRRELALRALKIVAQHYFEPHEVDRYDCFTLRSVRDWNFSHDYVMCKADEELGKFRPSEYGGPLGLEQGMMFEYRFGWFRGIEEVGCKLKAIFETLLPHFPHHAAATPNHCFNGERESYCSVEFWGYYNAEALRRALGEPPSDAVMRAKQRMHDCKNAMVSLRNNIVSMANVARENLRDARHRKMHNDAGRAAAFVAMTRFANRCLLGEDPKDAKFPELWT